ncbi:hypothetical protein C8J56DRAFT_1051590 [Mycena floridula]|nr:hypothetical protein C8J56DRAFT_1051590 [Mycena floridula]
MVCSLSSRRIWSISDKCSRGPLNFPDTAKFQGFLSLDLHPWYGPGLFIDKPGILIDKSIVVIVCSGHQGNLVAVSATSAPKWSSVVKKDLFRR